MAGVEYTIATDAIADWKRNSGTTGYAGGSLDIQVGYREGPVTAHHGSVIEELARETGREPARVKELYERELAHLEANAKVRGFLTVLACRRVRMALRETYVATN